jgi:hypothetical protein
MTVTKLDPADPRLLDADTFRQLDLGQPPSLPACPNATPE